MIKSESDDKVIASIENNDFSIYTFVKEGDNIEELIKKAETQFSNFPQYNRKYVCIEYDKYLDLQKEYYSKSCRAITEPKYWELLEVLPPIYIREYAIEGYEILNAFMVSEPLTCYYYDGVIKYRNRKGEIKYATKVIWRGDRQTYWTKEDLDNLERRQ